jgi:hypothetical protein
MVESAGLLVLAAHDEEQTLAMLSFGLEMTDVLERLCRPPGPPAR